MNVIKETQTMNVLTYLPEIDIDYAEVTVRVNYDYIGGYNAQRTLSISNVDILNVLYNSKEAQVDLREYYPAIQESILLNIYIYLCKYLNQKYSTIQ